MLISDFGYLLCLCKQMLFFLEIYMKAFKNKGHYLQLTLKGFRKKWYLYMGGDKINMVKC